MIKTKLPLLTLFTLFGTVSFISECLHILHKAGLFKIQ